MENTVTVDEEFQKNPELKSEDIEALKAWNSEQQPKIPIIPDKLLILFLHSAYFNLEQSKKTITRYYQIRANAREIFNNRDVTRPELKKALSVARIGLFPVRDPNGCVIIYYKLKIQDPFQFVFSDMVKLFLMIIDAALYMYGTVPGFVVLSDMTGVQVGHFFRVSICTLNRFLQYVQEGLPFRLKAVHVANTSTLIDRVSLLVRPFVQKKYISLVTFHYGDNSTMYEFLPLNCLPSDYGGDSESIDALHDRTSTLMENLLPYFQEEEECRRK